MYRHLLAATDGSALSEKSLDHAARLSKALAARLSVIYVSPLYAMPPYLGNDVYAPMPEGEYNSLAAEEAQQILAKAREIAEKAGASCDYLHIPATTPWEAILAVAEERGCDLIVMASHGRRGFSALLLGSETQKVLTYAKSPVLVVR